MALSTFFKDSKVAQFVGQVILLLPVLGVLNLLQPSAGNAKYALYPLMIFPSVPTLLIIMKYSVDAQYENVPPGVPFDK